ncbi:MAG TPA: carbon storage regulator [Acidiferrobacterales bacterium]
MLILTRKLGQILRVMPREGVGCGLTVGELFRDGSMEIVVGKVDGKHVRIGLKAHRGLLVMRGEIEGTALGEVLRGRGE